MCSFYSLCLDGMLKVYTLVDSYSEVLCDSVRRSGGMAKATSKKNYYTSIL